MSGVQSRAASRESRAATAWPDAVHRSLKEHRVRQVAYVPDSGHARLIHLARADRAMRAIPLTTEEEGVALAVGAWLGGERSVLLLQSSGVGNCINMLGMVQECRVPLLMLVTMRGQWGEFNPWQVQMGQAVQPVLEAVGVRCFPVDRAEEIGEVFAAAADMAFNSAISAAVLVSQRVIGAKGFGQK
jgi:sulfopyruvate decarboxylase alpha subunit